MGASDKNNKREWKISKEARIDAELFIKNLHTKKNYFVHLHRLKVVKKKVLELK